MTNALPFLPSFLFDQIRSDQISHLPISLSLLHCYSILFANLNSEFPFHSRAMAPISRCLLKSNASPLSLSPSQNQHHQRSRLRILSSAVRSSSLHSNTKLNLSSDNLTNWNSTSLSLETRWRHRRREDAQGRRKEAGKAQCSAGLEGIGGRVAREKSGGVSISERGKVVALMAVVMLLCNADRVVMSVAVVPLAAQYGWSSSFVGIVQSSFLWGYVISSMVGGTLADRYGGKRMMACAAALWSLATFLTPLAAHQSTGALLAVRALFGLAEGVAFPTMSTFLPRWFPRHERATAVGISMAGFHLGNVISFLATPIIMSYIGINGTFAFFASLGYAWLCMWLLLISNEPHESPRISEAELQLIQAGRTESDSKIYKFPSLKLLVSKMQMWAILVANIINNWGYFVLLSWMPVYFKTVYNVNLKQAAWFSAVPWAVMALSGYVAGATADNLIKSGLSVALVRKIVQSIGFVGPGVSLLCLNFAKTPAVAALLMTVALSLSSFSQAGYFCNIQDVAPKYAGSLHGITNGFGTVAAIISTIGAGYFVQWLGSFQAFLTLTAVLYFSATVFYNSYATGDVIFS